MPVNGVLRQAPQAAWRNAIACVLVSCFRFPRALCQGTTTILCAAGPDRYITAKLVPVTASQRHLAQLVITSSPRSMDGRAGWPQSQGHRGEDERQCPRSVAVPRRLGAEPLARLTGRR